MKDLRWGLFLDLILQEQIELNIHMLQWPMTGCDLKKKIENSVCVCVCVCVCVVELLSFHFLATGKPLASPDPEPLSSLCTTAEF
jgi:hypothetical protein